MTSLRSIERSLTRPDSQTKFTLTPMAGKEARGEQDEGERARAQEALYCDFSREGHGQDLQVNRRMLFTVYGDHDVLADLR